MTKEQPKRFKCPDCRSNCVCTGTRDVDMHNGGEILTEYAWKCTECPTEFRIIYEIESMD